MIYNPTSTANHFNQAASSYDNVAGMQRQHVAALITKLAGHLSGNATIADIGCGTGVFAKLAREHSLGWQVTGIDAASEMCNVASPFQAKTIEADMHDLPLGAESIDATVCAFTLQWSNDPALAIKELARITKPGGIVAVATFLDGTLTELAHACELAESSKRTNDFHWATVYEAWCLDAGLKMVSNEITKEQSTYPDVNSLFRTLKQMGATNSNSASIKGLGNRGELKAISEAYEKLYGNNGHIPASWEIGCWIYEK